MIWLQHHAAYTTLVTIPLLPNAHIVFPARKLDIG
jgi:hypothetical protein